MAARILAVDDSDISLKLLAAALTQVGYQVFTAPSGPEALKQVDTVHPDLIILDVMMPEMDGYEVCRRLRRNPNTARAPIMMLTAQDTLEEKIKGFEAGADEYMTKPFQPAELQARLEVLLRRAAPQVTLGQEAKVKGKTIAVFSLRGGVGVSTVAANLAVSLSQIWGSPAVLVDLALTAGHSALLLNLPPRTTWGDLAKTTGGEADADMINQVLLTHASGARVLAAPRRAEQGELITPDTVTHILTILSQQYQYVVLDLPHDLRDLTLAGLDKADQVLLLLAPELASVMSASAVLEIFGTLGYAKDLVRLVLNYTADRRDLAKTAIEEALKRPINVIVPNAPDIVFPAINKGTPVVFDKFNTDIGALLEDLAFFVSKEEQLVNNPPNPSPAWTRAAARAQQRKKK
jgi:pilus assembly protein CpaE